VIGAAGCGARKGGAREGGAREGMWPRKLAPGRDRPLKLAPGKDEAPKAGARKGRLPASWRPIKGRAVSSTALAGCGRGRDGRVAGGGGTRGASVTREPRIPHRRDTDP